MKRTTLVLALALASPWLPAAAAPSHDAVTITVTGERYLFGSRAFADLDALEKTIQQVQPSSITLVACGPSASNRALKAAAHRFRNAALEIVPRFSDEAPCSRPVLVPASHGAGERPAGIDDVEVDRYWRGLTP